MTNCRRVDSAFFVEANATVCSGVLLCPAALSQLFLKKSRCQVGIPGGYMDPSQFLEEVNAIPPFSKVAFMFSILYLLLVDIWKKILALFQISCKNIIRCSRRDCNSLKGTRRLPLRIIPAVFFWLSELQGQLWVKYREKRMSSSIEKVFFNSNRKILPKIK